MESFITASLDSSHSCVCSLPEWCAALAAGWHKLRRECERRVLISFCGRGCGSVSRCGSAFAGRRLRGRALGALHPGSPNHRAKPSPSWEDTWSLPGRVIRGSACPLGQISASCAAFSGSEGASLACLIMVSLVKTATCGVPGRSLRRVWGWKAMDRVLPACWLWGFFNGQEHTKNQRPSPCP